MTLTDGSLIFDEDTVMEDVLEFYSYACVVTEDAPDPMDLDWEPCSMELDDEEDLACPMDVDVDDSVCPMDID